MPDEEKQEIEVYSPPAFRPGDKVVSRKNVKNDGTMAGREIGEIVVRKGDAGYVRDIGVFLQQYYIYAVDFVTRDCVVGMRGRELAADGPRPERTPWGERMLQSHIVTRPDSPAAVQTAPVQPEKESR